MNSDALLKKLGIKDSLIHQVSNTYSVEKNTSKNENQTNTQPLLELGDVSNLKSSDKY